MRVRVRRRAGSCRNARARRPRGPPSGIPARGPARRRRRGLGGVEKYFAQTPAHRRSAHLLHGCHAHAVAQHAQCSRLRVQLGEHCRKRGAGAQRQANRQLGAHVGACLCLGRMPSNKLRDGRRWNVGALHHGQQVPCTHRGGERRQSLGVPGRMYITAMEPEATRRDSPAPYAFFRNMGVPQHFTAPLAMMAMRSPRMSARRRGGGAWATCEGEPVRAAHLTSLVHEVRGQHLRASGRLRVFLPSPPLAHHCARAPSLTSTRPAREFCRICHVERRE